MSSRKRIVICGGGAIGAAVAYFASRRGALIPAEALFLEYREASGEMPVTSARMACDAPPGLRTRMSGCGAA